MWCATGSPQHGTTLYCCREHSRFGTCIMMFSSPSLIHPKFNARTKCFHRCLSFCPNSAARRRLSSSARNKWLPNPQCDANNIHSLMLQLRRFYSTPRTILDSGTFCSYALLHARLIHSHRVCGGLPSFRVRQTPVLRSLSSFLTNLSDELNDTTGLGDLALSLGADVAGTDNDRDLGKTAYKKTND